MSLLLEAIRRLDMEQNTTDVVIVGGGLAGLAAAAYVARSGHTVTVLERSARLGGRAATDERDGFFFNQGPHALYRGGHGEEVLDELGVHVTGGPPAVAGRVVFDGRAELAPAGPATLLRTKALGVRGKTEIGRLLGSLPRQRAADHAHRTVSEWVDDSARDARARQLLHALVRLSTYANDPDTLSAEVAIAQLQLALGQGVLYLDHGWQTMIDQLAATPGVTVRTGTTVSELPDARAVILAVADPAQAGRLLGRSFDVGPAATASCLDLGLAAPPTHNFVLGGDEPFYFSNHSAAATLAPAGHHHAALVEYLAPGATPDVDALDRFAGHAGVAENDVVVRRRLHRMTTVGALATADRGGLAGRPRVADTGVGHVLLAGDWVGPHGHLADASLASARAASAAAIQLVESQARVH